MCIRFQFVFLPLFIIFSVGSAFLISAEEAIHVIRKGETIYSVARIYGVSYQDILSLNGIEDARKVQAGQRVRIPDSAGQGNGTIPAVPLSYPEYRVAWGDTLYGIARRYGITLEALRHANRLTENYSLRAGDRLILPVTGQAVSGLPVEVIPSQQAPVMPVPSAEPLMPVPVPDSAISTASSVTPPEGLSDARSTVVRSLDNSVRWPVNPKELAYMQGKLNGVLIQGERYEPVKSLTQGTVVSAGPYRGFGKIAIVQAAGGYLYVYGGCESLSVKEGDAVAPGTELGKLGVDAVSERPQLFFMVYRNSIPVDPATAPRV
jgi:murein DD-endopeptidase MepM/ murein hydrolase activator NlpD